ncbi:MAG TPA: translation initiation factor IF-3 [Verrucomicrobiae bacterium]|nr:translation initiation factor IF-3 [Verrucomicrobiae bacterium]
MSRPFSPRSFHSREPLHRRNGKIRAREVRVIGDQKQQLGVMPLNAALRLAYDKGLDLVEVAASAVPPVCRIVNYGKFLYEESKKESHSRQPAGRMKEIQISPAIDPHDLATKRNHAIKFLSDDMKVRVKLRFRGRQKAHKEIGFEVVNQFVKDIADYGHADSPPKMLGDRDLNVTLSPVPRSKRRPVPLERHTPGPSPSGGSSDKTEDHGAAASAPGPAPE